jgi:hypothetical protein
MANNRIFYACQAVQINGPSGTIASGTAISNLGYDTVQGLQSVGMNTNFNLEPIYQLGQIELYDNYEEIPEVEITLNKVLDGLPTLYEMTMGTGALASLANNRCGARLLLYPDTNTKATGVPTAVVSCAPAYLSSVSYTFPTEGNFTEEVTLVSNDKVWTTGLTALQGIGSSAPVSDSPSGVGILRRGLWNKSSILPNSGDTAGLERQSVSGGIPFGAKINSVKVSMNLGREQIRELGSRTPFYRYIKFPVEVSTEIEITANSGDMVGASGSSATPCDNPKALSNKEIVINLCDGTVIDLGKKNKLTTVNYTGGDTGGGNATITYSYRTYSEFTYTAPTGTQTSLAFSDFIEGGLPVPGTDY